MNVKIRAVFFFSLYSAPITHVFLFMIYLQQDVLKACVLIYEGALKAFLQLSLSIWVYINGAQFSLIKLHQ